MCVEKKKKRREAVVFLSIDRFFTLPLFSLHSFLIIPDMLKNSPMFKRIEPKVKAAKEKAEAGRGRGRGRGRGAA